MPSSPKLTPLAVTTLGLLTEHDMHAYEMFQLMLKRHEDRVVKVSAGTLYRTVERLEHDGFIVETATERAGNRPERTVYAITDAGRRALLAAIERMLRTFVNEFPEFPLAIGEAHNLPADEVVALLEERRASIGELVEFIDSGLSDFERRGLARRFVLDADYTRTMLTAEDAWLARTIAGIRDGSLPWEGDKYPDGGDGN